MIDHGFIGQKNMEKEVFDEVHKHLKLLKSYFENRTMFKKKVYWDLTNNKVFIGMHRHKTSLTISDDFLPWNRGALIAVTPGKMQIEYCDNQVWEDFGNVDWDHTICIGDF